MAKQNIFKICVDLDVGSLMTQGRLKNINTNGYNVGFREAFRVEMEMQCTYVNMVECNYLVNKAIFLRYQVLFGRST